MYACANKMLAHMYCLLSALERRNTVTAATLQYRLCPQLHIQLFLNSSSYVSNNGSIFLFVLCFLTFTKKMKDRSVKDLCLNAIGIQY